TFFVLDEADEMLNMGFLEDIEKILEQTNPDKRMLFFSATMPEPILDIAKKFMRKYEIIRTTPKQLTTHLVEQYYYEVPIKYKFEALCRIIDIEVDFYGLVFCKTKSDVDEVVSLLAERGYNAEALHGDISQHQREKILDKFKKKLVTILVATDVAARGIDIQNLTHVVNYSLPQDPESYVHRIGRTGRAGRTGIAISLVPPADIYKLQQIKRIAKVDIQQRRIPSGKDVVEAKKAKIRTEVSELVKANGFQDYKNAAEEILKEIPAVDALAAMLKYAFRNDLNEHAYADINPTKASKNKTERDRRGGDSIKEFFRTEEKGRKKSVRLFVALGKKDGVTPRKLVEFIEKETKVRERKIDDVQVLETFSFMTVPHEEAEVILDYFKKRKQGKKALIEVAQN
ncbi:MAG: DEAD/DEAH box helicase, partial [Flammeovirgaceae bacterium]|nr:DEAD/DEAH box helicase [Flammeovirgaceae bacterium]MDW8288473.1 DEAD/DEAH box helicase [Flammeovirgaceae bacterium]